MTVMDSDLKSDQAEVTQPMSLMEELLNDPSLEYKSLKYGDVMDGVIMRIDRDEILVDIGSKSEGIVPSREFSSLNTEEKDVLSIGETILVFVVQPENQEGQAVVSIDRARQEKSWRRLQELYEANEAIQAEVTNYNKGGLLVNHYQLRRLSWSASTGLWNRYYHTRPLTPLSSSLVVSEQARPPWHT